MNWQEFVARFPETTEIGRDSTENELRVFHDNQEDVGCFRTNRRTTEGTGEVLNEIQAACARDWCSRMRLEKAKTAQRSVLQSP